MQSPRVIIVLIIAGLTGTMAAGAYLFHVQQEKQAAEEARQIRILKIQEDRAHIQELFDNYLNALITDLRTKTIKYKKNRDVLKEMVNAYNFETTEFSKENLRIFNETIAPALRQNASDIITTFETYSAHLNQDLGKAENEIKVIFKKEWTAMTTKQLESYVTFFTKEEKKLQAYGDLITFYYVTSNLYTIDIENNVFVFKREQDQEQHIKLLKRLAQ